MTPNGICYDEQDDTLWCLCTDGFLVNLTKSGEIVSKHYCHQSDQDQICMYEGKLYFTSGCDYKGTNNFLWIFDTKTDNLIKRYRTTGSYAVEGVYYDGRELVIINDGLYHDDYYKTNYINLYRF